MQPAIMDSNAKENKIWGLLETTIKNKKKKSTQTLLAAKEPIQEKNKKERKK